MAAIATQQRAPVVRRTPVVLGGLVGALLVAALVDVLLGPAGIAPGRALRFLFSPDGSVDSDFVQSVRLPRAVAGAAAGAGFGVAGMLLQVAVRNPLAEPGTIGINAGALIAVTAASVLGLSLGPLATVPFALAGGLLAAALVLGLSRAGDPLRLVLAGMAISLALYAGADALRILWDRGAQPGLFIWGAGSTEQTGWSAARVLAPAIPALIAAAMLLARELDALALGDDVAEGLGVRAARTRLIAIGAAVLLAAVAVSLTGPIAFVGLAAPHLARRLLAGRHRLQLVVAALAGATLLLGADALALAVGGADIPAGVVATLCGAPFLIWIARSVALPAPATVVRSAARAAGRARWRPAPGFGVTIALGALLAALVGALSVGDLRIGAVDVVRGAFGEGPWAVVVQELRLPRALVAAVAGAGLALCGVILQGATRNPLAAPEILGVTGGASVGAVGLLLFVDAGQQALTLTAFAGGVAALALVSALAPRDLDPARVALIGVAIASACAAIVHVMLVNAGLEAQKAVIFLAGSTYAQDWSDLGPLVVLVGLGAVGSWLLARRLDALGAGDELATALGVPPTRTQLLLIALAAVLAAGSVATVGAVAFVGLMAPHIARLLVGPGHRLTLPTAALCGATILLLADLVGRSALTESRELPSGIVTALVGAPLLILLLRRR